MASPILTFGSPTFTGRLRISGFHPDVYGSLSSSLSSLAFALATQITPVRYAKAAIKAALAMKILQEGASSRRFSFSFSASPIMDDSQVPSTEDVNSQVPSTEDVDSQVTSTEEVAQLKQTVEKLQNRVIDFEQKYDELNKAFNAQLDVYYNVVKTHKKVCEDNLALKMGFNKATFLYMRKERKLRELIKELGTDHLGRTKSV
nr:hypothetical protein ASPGLDRAFT_50950 [Ipomoea batatas]